MSSRAGVLRSGVIQVRELSPDERAVVEKLVGHGVGDNDIVDVQAHHVVSPAPAGAARDQAVIELEPAMDDLAQRIDPSIASAELDLLIDEAADAARHERK